MTARRHGKVRGCGDAPVVDTIGPVAGRAGVRHPRAHEGVRRRRSLEGENALDMWFPDHGPVATARGG